MLALRYLLLCLCLDLIPDLKSVMAVRPTADRPQCRYMARQSYSTATGERRLHRAVLRGGEQRYRTDRTDSGRIVTYSNWPHLITTSHYHISLPLLITTSHYHISLPHPITTPHYHISLPHLITTPHYHTSLPHLITTSPESLSAAAFFILFSTPLATLHYTIHKHHLSVLSLISSHDS
jgi:hypothetical protein